MFYVVSYDITDNKKRNKIIKYLESYGVRVQYSVFEAELNETQLNSLKRNLKKSINLNEDTIRIYPLCSECRKKIETIGIDKGSYYKKDFLIV
ncbi:CRISPR-associated endoribonuclease Cas2 3 [Tepiditoga spiralis]|uniref:CRISPR-associated endoribonuclease Cas2 n=1 Tax=Tepiditoga spiralis TaxID=2108365 RepID=A0A7G1GBF3_9BACT|nr:CRISPR-associated endonuclease Cas2 [Tepiditoga spiralis]BBE31742.1 CRISPR-associated endoribonuclease Cas2 3 [Tepiditoga spiralis]